MALQGNTTSGLSEFLPFINISTMQISVVAAPLSAKKPDNFQYYSPTKMNFLYITYNI
jgi:hypothetical protein